MPKDIVQELEWNMQVTQELPQIGVLKKYDHSFVRK